MRSQNKRFIEQVNNVVASHERIAAQRGAETGTPDQFYCVKSIIDALKRTGEYVKTILEVLENMTIEGLVEECELE